MKKALLLLSSVLVCSLLFSGFAFANGEKNQGFGFKDKMFADVGFDNPYADAIYFGFNTGFVEGYKSDKNDERLYKPNNEINRAEFLKLVLEGTGQAEDKNYAEKCFPDVALDAWFSPYICQAKEMGLVQGYKDGFFRPGQTIKHAESLKILGELSAWGLVKAEDEPWFLPYESYAKSKKLLIDIDLGQNVNRGMVMEMVFRDLLVDSLGVASYDKSYISDLMWKYKVHYDDAWGPGGVFGPGGPLGKNGVNEFLNQGVAQMDSGTALEFLTDEYFINRYCYMSEAEQGSYKDLIAEEISRLLGVDFDSKKLDDFSLDDFGVIQCTFEPFSIEGTNTVLVSAELRNQYNIECWRDPQLSLSPSNNDLFETLYCHADSNDKEVENNSGEGNDDNSVAMAAATVSVSKYGSKTVAPDLERVELLNYTVNVGDKDFMMSEVELVQLGSGSTNALKKIYIENDDTGDILYGKDDLTMGDWENDKVLGEAMLAKYSNPVIVPKGMSGSYTVYGDFDWEYDDGNIQLGLIVLQNDIDLLGESILGAKINRGAPEGDNPGVFENGYCAIYDSEAHLPYGENEDGVPAGHVGEAAAAGAAPVGAHDVKPINQGDRKICAAASVYSSLRWFEEKFDLDGLIENGQSGLDELISKLHGPEMTSSRRQLDALVDWVNTERPECLNIDYNTQSWWNVTCNELLDYKDKGCDIPLMFSCYPVDADGNKNGKEWGHAVDLTDVKIDPNDGNQCTVNFANSWAADDGTGVDLDGLGAGRFEEATYNDDNESFVISSPWAAGYKCSLYAAAYICIDKDKCE